VSGIARPAWALARRELVRFFRQRGRVVGALGTPLILWGLLGTGLGAHFRVAGLGGGEGYLSYFFPGMVAMVVLFTAIFGAISVIQDRDGGVLQAVLVAPVPRAAVALGLILGGTAVAAVQGAVLLPLAATVGGTLAPLRQLLALLAIVGMALGVGATGLVFAWRTASVQSFHGVMNLVLFPMWVLSGALFPPAGWLGGVMLLNPVTYGVAGLRGALFPGGLADAPGAMPLWLALGVTWGFAVIMLAVAARIVGRR
jgi:ABC-2 type transport system permease protein